MEKNKLHIILISILFILISLTCIYASDEVLKIDNHTFNVPSEYEVELEEESNFLLISEETPTFIYINNRENLLDNYTSQGYSLDENKNFTIDDKNVIQNYLTKDNSTLYVYSIEGFDNLNIIIKTGENNWDINNLENPVNNIINTLN